MRGRSARQFFCHSAGSFIVMWLLRGVAQKPNFFLSASAAPANGLLPSPLPLSMP